jgi:hypothetical protein
MQRLRKSIRPELQDKIEAFHHDFSTVERGVLKLRFSDFTVKMATDSRLNLIAYAIENL